MKNCCVLLVLALLAGWMSPDAAHGSSPRTASKREALETYLDTGEPPVISHPTESSFPYGGETVATVRCQPYRACAVRLEEGETILGRAVGDTERWSWVELDGGPAPLVVVKPEGYDTRTNALIVTDERVYRLELVSPAREEAEEVGYDSIVSWWYPEDWASAERRSARAKAEAEQLATDRKALPGTPFGATRLEDLHVHYEIRRPLLRRLDWKPRAVLDDGETTVIHLPWEARHLEPPVVLGKVGTEDAVPLNARLDPSGAYLLVPAVVDELRLVVGKRSLKVIRQEGNDG